MIHSSILGVNSCLNFTCWKGSQCSINHFGTAECRCPELCESLVSPVCGTDGYTYESKCHLKQNSCSKRFDVKVAFNGYCGKKIIYL